MHRFISAPRSLGWPSLLIAIILATGMQTASAQEKALDGTGTGVLIMTAGTSQNYQATSKERLKSVTNPNPKVLNVQRIVDKFDTVLFEALLPGRTKVEIVDVKGRIEYVDVVVVSDRVAELRNMLQRAIPTGSITVSSTDSGNAAVLTGFVQSADDARIVQQIASQIFGANFVNNVRIGGVQQVQLEVVVAIVNRSLTRAMAFSFTENTNKAFLGSIFGPGMFNTIGTPSLSVGASGGASLLNATGGNVPFGVLNGSSGFYGYLTALRTEGLTKILAEPRITTLSGRPASIVSGGETPILTSSGVGAPSVAYKQFGTVVNFLPIVLGNGKIHLEVRPEISDLDAANGITIAGATTTSVPGFSIRSVQVAVQMEDGQTLAIGGLIQNKVNSTISRVPVLGDIPFLSFFFTSKSVTEDEEELLILVTPRLVDPVDCTKIPKYLPGRETRQPDDFELYLEGVIEVPHGQRNVSCNPFKYKAPYLSGATGGLMPCNDTSGNYGRGGNCANGACGTPSAYPILMPATNASISGNTNAMPMPATQSIPMARQPASSNARPPMQQDPPITVSPMRDGAPNLGEAIPVIPALPTNQPAPIPGREAQPRPVLPPASFGPASQN